MIRPAYRYATIHLSGTTAPPIRDPDPGADPWAGVTEQTFIDADGVAITSIFIVVGAKENEAVIRFSRDGIVWGDDIIVYSDDNPVTRYVKAQKMQIRNETAGSNADVQAEIYG